jgi:hypothetical protein
LLITNQYIQKAGYKCRVASEQTLGVRSGGKNKSKIHYRVLLHRIDGSLGEFWRCGEDKIAGNAVSFDIFWAKKAFSQVVRKLTTSMDQ